MENRNLNGFNQDDYNHERQLALAQENEMRSGIFRSRGENDPRQPHACEASTGSSFLFICLSMCLRTHSRIVKRQLVGKDQDFLN